MARGRAKELLSVGGLPLVRHALRDLAASGIREALVVTSRDKPELQESLGTASEGVALRFELQQEPLGLADALSLAEGFAAGEPFLCWLPDNLWSGFRPASGQLDAARRHLPAAHAVGLIEVPAADLELYGAAGFVETTPIPGEPALVRIDRVHDKGTRSAASSRPDHRVLKGFPLDLWQPDLFDRIRRQRGRHERPAGPELDDTPILQELAREGRLMGVVLQGGRLFDCGIPSGLAAARAALGGE